MKTYFPALILSTLLFIAPFIHAYSQDITFAKLPEFKVTEFGYGCVVDITQDPEGYMWFATLNGLYRTDGYRVVAYHADQANPQSLAINWLNTVYADETGLIWIGTFGKGMDCLNPKTGIIKHYTYKPTNKESICSDTVTMIRGSKKGFLWVGTNNGLTYFDIKAGKFTRYQHNENDPNSISDNQIRVIYTDKKGTTWFGTRSAFKSDNSPMTLGGLNRFNPKTGKFTRFMHNPNNPGTLIDNHITAIFEDSEGTFWVGTAGDGLHTMDRKTGTFTRHTYDKTQPEKLSRPPQQNTIPYANDFISFINEDAAKKIWIGTFSGGMNQYDPVTKKVSFFDVGNDPKNPISRWCFTSFVSKDSVFWVAPWLSELYKGDSYPKTPPFTPFTERVTGVIQERTGLIWLCGANGFIRKDPKTGRQKKYSHDPENPNSLCHNEITYVVAGKHNTWWIATFGGGLDLFKPSSRSFAHYKHDSKNKNTLSGDTLNVIYADGDNLWIGTQRGLDMLTVATGKFSHYIHNEKDPDNEGHVTVLTMLARDKNTLWMGTGSSRGMSVLDRKTGKIQKHYLEGKFVTHLFTDHQGIIWATTDDGLYRYDTHTDNFARFTDPDHFIHIGSCIDIQEDNKQNLWVQTKAEFYKISPKRDHIYTYTSDHLRQENYDYYANFVVIETGSVCFFTQKGYFFFTGSEVKNNPIPPQISISTIDIAGDSTGTGHITQQLATNQRELALAFHQNTFSIAFTPIHFGNPEKNKIIFKLDGIDTDWRESGNERKASYFNLPPGTYTFRLRACNDTGAWSERQFMMTITPPWWRTWWAYLLYVLTFGYAIWSFIAYRSRELQRKNQALQEKVNALEEVKEALLKGQKIERRRVAADLHDNLGGMVSAIRLTIEAMDASTFSKKEHEVYQNVLGMTRQAYNEIRLLSHNLQPDELEKFGLAQALQRLMTNLNSSQPIQFSLHMNPSERLAKDLEFNLYSICMELTNNIIKHSQATEASFDFGGQNGQLQLFVTDNGQGFIPNNTSDGMGMRTVQERTEQMGGTLKIHSRPGEGTLFQFSIPLSRPAHVSART